MYIPVGCFAMNKISTIPVTLSGSTLDLAICIGERTRN